MSVRNGSRVAVRRNFAQTFISATNIIRRLRGRETHRSQELSSAQYSLLFALQETGRVSAGQLAAAADISPASVTHTLSILAERGYIHRVRSEVDRRVVMCEVAEPALALLEERRADLERRWDEALAPFTVAEIAKATEIVQRVGQLFDDLEQEWTLTEAMAADRQNGQVPA